MPINRYIDFTMRDLVCLAAHPDSLCAITEMTRADGISQNHVKEVVHQRGEAGDVTGVRGSCGDVGLARTADTRKVGAAIRYSEMQPDTDERPMLCQ